MGIQVVYFSLSLMVTAHVKVSQKSHSFPTRCVRTACSQLLTSLEQVVIIL